jgi:transcriptional regulator with XRE-family HTH domain
MKNGVKWNDLKQSINSISDTEKTEIEATAKIMASIIKRRKELKISQRDLEKLSGIKQSAIARIEKQNNSPSIETLIKLMEPLGLTLTVTNSESANAKVSH